MTTPPDGTDLSAADGAGTARARRIGMRVLRQDDPPPSPDEQARMRRLLPPALKGEVLAVRSDLPFERWVRVPEGIDAPEEIALSEGSLVVELDTFTGPLDLLVDLVRRRAMDPFQVPLATVVENFVEYLQVARPDLDDCGDFAALAAQLMRLKVRAIFAQDAEAGDTEETEQGGDPRPLLVRKLLTLESYRHAGGELMDRPLLERDTFVRAADDLSEFEDGERALEPVELPNLIRAFERIAARMALRLAHTVQLDEVNVEHSIARIAQWVRLGRAFTFEDLCAQAHTKGELVATLLAVLELTRLRLLKLMQDGATGDLVIRARATPEAFERLAAGGYRRAPAPTFADAV